MTLRRMLVSLGLLITLAGTGLGLLVLRGRPSPAPIADSRVESGFVSFKFSYQSQSELNPVLPGGQGLNIGCDAAGLVHLQPSLALLFEFTFVHCDDADVLEERGLLRRVHYSREFLASEEAMQRATEDPVLAISRGIFLQMTLEAAELRLEGRISPRQNRRKDQDAIHWSKTFSGVPETREKTALTHTLEIQISARSEDRHPLEMGLLQLDGHETSVSMQGQRQIARTTLTIHIQRETVVDATDLPSLFADTPANRPASAPRLLTAEEKEAILKRWRLFRDHEGQKPARGSAQDNQEEYLELKKALRQEPALADELKDDLNETDPSSSAFATLAGALVYSGTEAGLNAFVQKAREHKADDSWQTRAVPMLGLAPVPTEESWTYLNELRKDARNPDLKSAAELGMATHLKRGYQDSEFASEIEKRMTEAQTDAERLHLLDLVGNAGLDQVFPRLEAWYPGASLPLRLRILQSLRFMSRPDAERFLLREAGNTSIELALTALQSLQERTLGSTAITPLLSILENRRDDRLRLQALECLYAARHLDPELLNKVQRIREGTSVSPALNEAWKQVEKDWVDPVET